MMMISTVAMMLTGSTGIGDFTFKKFNDSRFGIAGASANNIDPFVIQVMDSSGADISGKHKGYAASGEKIRNTRFTAATLVCFDQVAVDDLVFRVNCKDGIVFCVPEMFIDKSVVDRNCYFHIISNWELVISAKIVIKII